VDALVAVTGRVTADQSRQLPVEAARKLAVLIEKAEDVNERQFLAESLARIALLLPPAEAAHMCEKPVQTLMDALEKETDHVKIAAIAKGLASLSSRIPSLDAAKYCRRAAKQLPPMTEKDASNSEGIAGALAEVCTHLPPSEASSILVSALEKRPDPWTSRVLAEGLSSAASRLAPAEAARVCGRCARMLADSLSKETDWFARLAWSRGLSALAAWLHAEDADRLCSDAIMVLLRLRLNVSQSLYASSFDFQYDASVCDHSIAVLISQIGDQKAEKSAPQLAQLMCSELGVNNENWQLASPRSTNLNLLITRHGRRDKMDETGTADASTGDDQKLTGTTLPCRLATQELVDLLKMPTCIGVARRIVLDHLGNRYSRHFINHWAFVRFAREGGLNLDFTAPPKRPDPKESVKRMLEVLDEPASGS
jgi:hypothetical protein